MSKKTPLRSAFLSLAAVMALSACDGEVGPEQRFEVDLEQPTLMQLAELAEVDLEFDDYMVYSQPLGPHLPLPEPVVDECGACIEGQNELLCIDASCTVGSEPIFCENGRRTGEHWDSDDGVNICWCTLSAEVVCTLVG